MVVTSIAGSFDSPSPLTFCYLENRSFLMENSRWTSK